MNKEKKNRLAYNDVLECNGPSISNDAEYMEAYRFWYSLGNERRESHEWDESCYNAGDFIRD